jgi:hypothetical protein
MARLATRFVARLRLPLLVFFVFGNPPIVSFNAIKYANFADGLFVLHFLIISFKFVSSFTKEDTLIGVIGDSYK